MKHAKPKPGNGIVPQGNFDLNNAGNALLWCAHNKFGTELVPEQSDYPVFRAQLKLSIKSITYKHHSDIRKNTQISGPQINCDDIGAKKRASYEARPFWLATFPSGNRNGADDEGRTKIQSAWRIGIHLIVRNAAIGGEVSSTAM